MPASIDVARRVSLFWLACSATNCALSLPNTRPSVGSPPTLLPWASVSDASQAPAGLPLASYIGNIACGCGAPASRRPVRLVVILHAPAHCRPMGRLCDTDFPPHAGCRGLSPVPHRGQWCALWPALWP
ncbi:hypothetical protein BLA29_000036 [Euroglyphus maynei]|uniref:Secreted protein n=1 Tax=Euroglyphus maynei TaxID=6958 RepID=A0A1Y3AR64_EURMA|nr:hypothetical protein BLA29_000036 [Euroglyphus maynei]